MPSHLHQLPLYFVANGIQHAGLCSVYPRRNHSIRARGCSMSFSATTPHRNAGYIFVALNLPLHP